jgi:uncharacterized membrane protein
MTPNQRNAIAFFAGLTWMIIGTIWIAQSKYYDHFCQRNLFNLSAVMVVIQWAILAASFYFTCNVSCRSQPSSVSSSDSLDSDGIRLLKI